MKKLITAHWFLALLGALTYLGTTLACFCTASIGTLPATDTTEEARHPTVTESWAYQNPELEQMVKELKQEKEALAVRSQQLKELEARVASERQEINLVAETVARVQRELDQALLRIRQEDVANLKKLAKIHAAMSPEGSANIFKEQTDEEILKVLFYLKPSESGPMLEAFGKIGKTEAQRAALLTERMRRTIEAPAEKGRP